MHGLLVCIRRSQARCRGCCPLPVSSLPIHGTRTLCSSPQHPSVLLYSLAPAFTVLLPPLEERDDGCDVIRVLPSLQPPLARLPPPRSPLSTRASCSARVCGPAPPDPEEKSDGSSSVKATSTCISPALHSSPSLSKHPLIPPRSPPPLLLPAVLAPHPPIPTRSHTLSHRTSFQGQHTTRRKEKTLSLGHAQVTRGRGPYEGGEELGSVLGVAVVDEAERPLNSLCVRHELPQPVRAHHHHLWRSERRGKERGKETKGVRCRS